MEGISEPKKIISLSWDDPWRKYEEKFKKNPKGEDALLVSDLSLSERKRRKRKTRYSKKFRIWRNSIEVILAVPKRMQRVSGWKNHMKSKRH